MTEVEILEQTYFDLCTIKRKVKTKNSETGVTETILKVISENTKCALSKKDMQVINVDGLGKLNFTHSLFLSPNVDVKEGDLIEVTCINEKLIFLASKPFKYSSHSEIPITHYKRA